MANLQFNGQMVVQGSRYDYNYKEFYVDTAADIATIDTSICCPGSVVFVIEDSEAYMLTSDRQWVVI